MAQWESFGLLFSGTMVGGWIEGLCREFVGIKESEGCVSKILSLWNYFVYAFCREF